jgi:hypothetical protein
MEECPICYVPAAEMRQDGHQLLSGVYGQKCKHKVCSGCHARWSARCALCLQPAPTKTMQELVTRCGQQLPCTLIISMWEGNADIDVRVTAQGATNVKIVMPDGDEHAVLPGMADKIIQWIEEKLLSENWVIGPQKVPGHLYIDACLMVPASIYNTVSRHVRDMFRKKRPVPVTLVYNGHGFIAIPLV